MNDLIEVSGVTFEPWKEVSQTFCPELSGLSGNLREDTIRQQLSTISVVDDRLNLVWSELLYEVKTNKYWKKWGFKNFIEYANEELDLERQKAYSLADIYHVYVVLCDIPEDELQTISFTKAYIAKTYLKRNPRDWEDVLKAMEYNSCEQFRDYIAVKSGKKRKKARTITLSFENEEDWELWEATRDWVSKDMGYTDKQASPAHVFLSVASEFLGARLDKPGAVDLYKSLERLKDYVERAFHVKLDVSEADPSVYETLVSE